MRGPNLKPGNSLDPGEGEEFLIPGVLGAAPTEGAAPGGDGGGGNSGPGGGDRGGV